MELELLPEFLSISPTVTKSDSHVKVEGTDKTYTVIGTNDRYKDMMKIELDKGRFLAPADVEYRNQVAAIGSNVARTYFGNRNPVGQPKQKASSVSLKAGFLCSALQMRNF